MYKPPAGCQQDEAEIEKDRAFAFPSVTTDTSTGFMAVSQAWGMCGAAVTEPHITCA